MPRNSGQNRESTLKIAIFHWDMVQQYEKFDFFEIRDILLDMEKVTK